MKRISIYKQIGILLSVIVLASCDSFLDELPDNRAEIDTPEKIRELLVSAYPDALHTALSEAMSDNADNKVNKTDINRVNETAYHWEDHTDITRDTPTFYWMAVYKAIATANQALEAVASLGGGSELDYLRGEALVARAYGHFMLATLWCKPYNSATASTDMALPYVTSSEKNAFVTYKRISIQEYYDLIEKDLKEGIPLIQNSSYKQPKFHFTKEAANGFASRFYLMKGQWDKVLEHANAVFANADLSQNLRDITGSSGLSYAQKRIQYSSSSESANLLIVGASSLYGRSSLYVPKYGLTPALYTKIFSSTRHPLGLNWSYSIYGTDEALNMPKCIEYFKYTSVSDGIGYPYAMFVLLSYDEVLLNRVEANIMLGNYSAAVEDLKVYLPKKTSGTITTVLTEDDINTKYTGQGTEFAPNYTLEDKQRAWLQCIIDLRQIEFYHEGIRWFDNKRLGMKITHTSPKGTFELTKDDPRRELQLPAEAIADGLTPNPR